MEFYKEITIEDFGELIAGKVIDLLGKNYSVEFKEMIKNNGSVRHAIVVHKLFDPVAPAIYIDDLYEQALERDDIRFLPEYIVECYNKSIKHEIEVEFFKDFSKVAEFLTFKLVNEGKNEEMLKDVPYRQFEDLALVPICKISNNSIGEGMIVIRNEHLKLWEISEDELWKNIHESARAVSGVKIENLADFSRDKFGVPFDMFLNNMFVITNDKCVNGASAAFFPGVLKEVAEMSSSDLILIPSSVHEMISVPAEGEIGDIGCLLAIIKEVNDTVVMDEDVLSDNAYYYNARSERLSILKADKDE